MDKNKIHYDDFSTNNKKHAIPKNVSPNYNPKQQSDHPLQLATCHCNRELKTKQTETNSHLVLSFPKNGNWRYSTRSVK